MNRPGDQISRGDNLTRADAAGVQTPPSARTPATPFGLSGGLHETFADVGDSVVDFQPGQIVADQFEVIRLLGRGGMGVVYEVRDRVTRQNLALKAILPSVLARPQAVERFVQEVNTSRRLRHDGIVAVYDFRHAPPLLFFTMEYLEGITLRKVLLDQRKLPLPKVVQILSALCDALEYAHTFTVHRDISPENVMLLKDGKLKLLDFGIAKVMDTSAHTTASVSMGKAYYAAPEQRKDASRVDQRADIFSLGVLFFEMLTGELPVGYNRITEIMPLLPAKCDEVISRTLAPVERRYRNVAEFRQAIAACVKAAAGPQALARDDAREMAPVRQPSEPPEAPAVALDDPWPFKSVPASGEVTPKVSLRLPRLPRWLTVRRAVVLGCLIPIGLIVAGVAASQISFRTAQREAAQLRSQITDDHREHAAQEVGAAEKAWDAAQGAGWHFSEAKAQYAKAAEEYGKAVRATDARIKLSGVKADAAQARDDLDKLKKTASAETWQLANTDAEAGETAWKTGLAAEQWPLSALTHFEGALRSFNAAIQKLAAAPAEENPEAATKKTASSSRAERKARLAGWVKADVEVSPDKLDADGLYKVSRRTPLIVAPDGQSIEQAINNDQDTRQLPPDGMFRVNSSIRAAKNKWYKVLISEDGGANYYWLNSADLAGQDLEMAYEPKVAAPEQPAGALEPQRGRERIDSAPTTPYVPRYRKQANQPYGVQATPVMPTQVNWLSP